MAQVVKYSLQKHKDLYSTPGTHFRSWLWLCILVASVLGGRDRWISVLTAG